MHFVERVGVDEADALRRALAEFEAKHARYLTGDWRSGPALRDTDGVSALAFTFVALMLVGPVPALLARASWPLRAPRAAIVLWQSIALAAVLSRSARASRSPAGCSSRSGRPPDRDRHQ